MTIACSLVASRVMSMSFLPLLAYYILKPGTDPAADRPRDSRFGKAYERAVTFAIDHRWKVLAASSLGLAAGAFFVTHLHRQFFPRDNFYIAYVDIRLPEDAPIAQTARVAREADQIIREVTTSTIGVTAPSRRSRPSRRSSERRTGSGFRSVPSRPPRITRSCCCNSLEAKTPIGWWPAPGGPLVACGGREIDVRTVETGPPRSSRCRCGSWATTPACSVKRRRSCRPS